MSPAPTQPTVARAGLVVALGASLLALAVSGEVEVALVMLAGVAAALAGFESALTRRPLGASPWMVLSLAPVLKVVPTVWLQLISDTATAPLRYDRAGSLLFGLAVLVATAMLARPAPELGPSEARRAVALIFGCAATTGVAGASLAYLFDTRFGTPGAARVLETSTWTVVGGLLASVVLAASYPARLRLALVVLLVTSSATAGVLALSISGRRIDLGWWAVLFCGLTCSASLGGADAVGEMRHRTRRSKVLPSAAAVAGLCAAASAIAARGDRVAWSAGWVLLGLIAMAMFALALRALPDAPASTRAEEVLTPTTVVDAPAPVDEPGPQVVTNRTASGANRTRRQRVATANEPVSSVGGSLDRAASTSNVHAAAVARIEGVPIVANEQPGVGHPSPTRTAISVADRTRGQAMSQLHHFDPSTGLLSAAGLQQVLRALFRTPRAANDVTMMLVAIRDLDQIEAAQGRLRAAAVVREAASRLRTLLPACQIARFGRSAFAVVLVSAPGTGSGVVNVAPSIEELARVLAWTRSSVDGVSAGAEIDVVGGMAQCYAGEDVSLFVQRANAALERAIGTPEGSFVAAR